jgi:O-acetyl-ADP-ribose deacetylase (regulator of RNase III)
MARDPGLRLEDYRDLVSLDVPFHRADAAMREDRGAWIDLAVAHLEREGGAARHGDLARAPAAGQEAARARLRALLTVRAPGPLPDVIHEAIDRLVGAEYATRSVVDPAGLPRLAHGPRNLIGRASLWQGDITALAADAIVNAANAELLGCFVPFHACIDNTIHWMAGPRLRQDCAAIMAAQGYPEPTGTVKATRAYNLPSRFVLHTVGPVVRESVTPAYEQSLSRCYRACLDIAVEIGGVRSVAFCSISTGVFGYPAARAARVAVRAVDAWFGEHPGDLEQIVFDVFTDRDRVAYKDALREEGGADDGPDR